MSSAAQKASTTRARRLLAGDYWPDTKSRAARALLQFHSDAKQLRAAGSKLADDAQNCARWIAGEIIAGVR